MTTSTPTSATDGGTPRRTLFLIDGHAQFFRAYFAIRSGMTSPVTSEPTNMVFGFVGILLKLMRDYRPDHLAVVIDVSGDRESFRSEMYPAYKAHRDAPPEDFHGQVERCLQILQEMHIPVVGEAGVEADDVIATLVRRLERDHPELDIRIVSRDKDLAQLLTDRVQLLDIYKEQLVVPGDIFKVEGVAPEQVVDILALMGDATDNVPGVPGIGPKTAAKLILEYGTLDNLMAHLDEIRGKRRENLEASRDQIDLARRLVELKDDVPCELELDATRLDLASIPPEPVLSTFRELGFNQHGENLRRMTGAETPRAGDRRAAPSAEPAGESLFEPAPPPPAPTDVRYALITSTGQLDQLVDEIRRAGFMSLDTETDSLRPVEANLCGVSISLEPGTGAYVPTRSPAPQEHLDTGTVLAALRPVIEDPSIIKIGHNLKYDLNVLRRHGVALAGEMFDTMIASYVIDATRSSHKLDVLALAILDHVCTPITDLIGRGRAQKTFDQVPLDQAAPYAAEDADVALRLREAFAPRVRELGLEAMFGDVEMPLVPVLAEMEFNGIRLDPQELGRQRDQLSRRIERLRSQILEEAPHPFNPDSPKQLSVVLFNRPDQDPPGLGLPVSKRGKTGPSTDQEVMERLTANPSVTSPVPALIVEYRQLAKLVSTYLEALAEAINPATGRVHCSFNQTVAATGRLSASDPNLQNIPIRTEVGREIRRAFIAEPGCVLLTADYSQIELRLLAHLAEDPALIEAFSRGADIHSAVAAEVYDVDPAEVTSSMRTSAKMINFGIVYGITPFGLARRLGPDVSVDQAKEIIDGYRARFSRIDLFLAECIQIARDQGYVQTILGRRRAIPQVKARQLQQRALGERMAINTVVQGSAADLIKLAMIELHRTLPEAFPEAKLVLQIHDELVFEVPKDRVEPLRDFVVGHMTGAMELKVDLVVDTAWAANWIDA